MAKNFYFAWVDANTAFNPAVHNVEDEDVFAFDVSQSEGDFAAMNLVIKNPRVGLLATGRKVWAYLSYDRSEDDTPDLVPLFFGRLVGIPTNVFDTLVTLIFTARPFDYVAQKAALAETLRVAPYWDPIFVAPDKWEDPDVVLEARSALWHIDRVTHELTISDVIIPEDGVQEILATEAFYDSMELTLQTVPLRSVSITATIPWTQTAGGFIDLSNAIVNAFPSTKFQMISSFTFEGLVSSWPKIGAGIGEGWVVQNGSLSDEALLSVQSFKLPEYYAAEEMKAVVAEGSVVFEPKISGKIWGGEDGAGFDIDVELVIVPIGWGRPVLNVTYETSRELAEVVTLTMNTAMQAIATLDDDADKLLIAISANRVSDTTFNEADVPIVDTRRRNYTDTDRGRMSVEHLIMIGRANLIIRSRAVQVAFDVEFDDAIQVSLRMGALIHDPRLPGGEAEGKLTAYTFGLDGSSGEPTAKLTIGCAVGYGGAHTEADGDPTYAEEGYVNAGYQTYINVITLTESGDLTYTMPEVTYFDDGLDFIAGLNASNAIQSLIVTNPASSQKGQILSATPLPVPPPPPPKGVFIPDFGTGGGTIPDQWYNPVGQPQKGVGDQAAVNAVLQTIPTQISLLLVPVKGGPFIGGTEIIVSDLIIPKQIDLEAASV